MADNSEQMLAAGHWKASIARMDLKTQKRIAADDRPLTTVSREYGISLGQLSRLRALHREIPWRPEGRGTTYTPQRGAGILKYFSEGINWKESCEAAGVPVTTAYQWLDQHPHFAKARAHALELWGKAKEAEIAAISDDPSIPAKQKAIMIKSRQWLMERMLSEYRLKAAQQSETNVTINYLQLLQQAEDRPITATIDSKATKALK